MWEEVRALFRFANNVRSHLVTPLTAAAETFSITAGDGAKFPAPDTNNGETTALTIVDDSGNMEIVYVLSRVGDTFTILRAQEGTTAKDFAEGAVVEIRITANALNVMSYVQQHRLQSDEIDRELPVLLSSDEDVQAINFGAAKYSSGITVNHRNGRLTAPTFRGKLDGSLTTPRSIDGVSFDGSANVVRYGKSDTPAAETIKQVTINSTISDPPQDGTIIAVIPTVNNSAALPISLSVNGGTAYTLRGWGTNLTWWYANRPLQLCFFDGTWNVLQTQDTNSKVGQYATANTVTGNFPILTTYIANLAASQNNYSRFVSNITITPSTGTVTAPKFSGELIGNASTATTATTATNATKWNGATMYKSTAGPSGGANGDVWLQYI